MQGNFSHFAFKTFIKSVKGKNNVEKTISSVYCGNSGGLQVIDTNIVNGNGPGETECPKNRLGFSWL